MRGVVFVGLLGLSSLAWLGCGGGDTSTGAGGGGGGVAAPSFGCDPGAEASRTISCVVSYSPGEAGGFGEDHFPEIIYGPPEGGGDTAGSTDVLSLGRGGEIVVGFGGNAIVDGDGPDFIVFENAFYQGGDPNLVFAEPGEVSVSADGETWFVFPCNTAKPYEGCAGKSPVFAREDLGISPFDVMSAGGDAFDLADLGLAEARFVRIKDVSNFGGSPTAGFDLDAIAIVNARK